MAIASLGGLAWNAAAAEFHWLDINNRTIEGLSADGSTVSLGFAYWTSATGLVNLEPQDGRQYVVRSPIYSGGVVIGGVRNDVNSPVTAFRWTEANGFEYLTQDLPPPSGLASIGSIARRMSADGSTIAGFSNWRHALWTSNEVTEIGPFPTETVYSADQGLPPLSFGGMSDDGSVVVGSYTLSSPDASQPRYAYRWSSERGLEDLGTLPAQDHADASAISGNGMVIVGHSGNEAFQWTEAGGMQGLGILPNWSMSIADGISTNGDVILGRSFDRNSGSQPGEMFVWDEVHGMRNLTQMVLTELGVDLTGAGAIPKYISSDLRTVAGSVGGTYTPFGDNTWVVTFDRPLGRNVVPEPCCQALLVTLLAGLVATRRRTSRAGNTRPCLPDPSNTAAVRYICKTAPQSMLSAWPRFSD